MAQTNYAELFRGGDAWYVRYTSEPLRSSIRQLFGTVEIPLPFTPAATFETVFHALRQIPANADTAFVEAK